MNDTIGIKANLPITTSPICRCWTPIFPFTPLMFIFFAKEFVIVACIILQTHSWMSAPPLRASVYLKSYFVISILIIEDLEYHRWHWQLFSSPQIPNNYYGYSIFCPMTRVSICIAVMGCIQPTWNCKHYATMLCLISMYLHGSYKYIGKNPNYHFKYFK